MWLLDANMDAHLVAVLEELGIVADTAKARGWAALSNGDLVAKAIEAGFTCLLTHDRAFGQSAARALQNESEFAVVVGLRQQPSKQYCERFKEAWERQSLQPEPGAIINWP